MDKIVSAVILIVVVLAIVYWLLPLLSGIWYTIGLVITVLGGTVGLLKIVGAWF